MKHTNLLPAIAVVFAAASGCRTQQNASVESRLNLLETMVARSTSTNFVCDSLLSRVEFNALNVEISIDTSGRRIVKIPQLEAKAVSKRVQKTSSTTRSIDSTETIGTIHHTMEQETHKETTPLGAWSWKTLCIIASIAIGFGYWIKKQIASPK